MISTQFCQKMVMMLFVTSNITYYILSDSEKFLVNTGISGWLKTYCVGITPGFILLRSPYGSKSLFLKCSEQIFSCVTK